MICLAYIDKNVLDGLKKENIPENFLIFLKKLIDDYDENSSNIVLVDDRKNTLFNSIISLSRSTQSIKLRALLEALITRIKDFEIKPLIKSISNNPEDSNYVDIKITSVEESKKKSISIQDIDFENRVKEIKRQYSLSILSNEFGKKNHKEFFRLLEKIFLTSREINFTRTSMGEQLLPYNKDFGFNDIDRAGSKNRKHYHIGISTIYLLIYLIANVKKEGSFLEREEEIKINIFSDIDDSNIYGNPNFEVDEKDAINKLNKNLSYYSALRKTLEKFKIKINFNFFIYSNKESESKLRYQIKNLLHFRWLCSSNGIFHIGHDDLIEGVLSEDAKFKQLKHLTTYPVVKIKNNSKNTIKSAIFQNCHNIFSIRHTYPN